MRRRKQFRISNSPTIGKRVEIVKVRLDLHPSDVMLLKHLANYAQSFYYGCAAKESMRQLEKELDLKLSEYGNTIKYKPIQ